MRGAPARGPVAWAAGLALLASGLVLAPPALPAARADPAAARGAAWLARAEAAAPGGQQADAIVAMAAAGRTPAQLRGALARLARAAPAYATTAGAAGKVALAAVAAGGDPRSLGGVDYLARIRRAYAAGRFGASGYDQALSMLALAGAGEPVPRAAVTATRAARGAGGWGFDLSPTGTDDPSTTGLLVEALRAAGVRPADPALRGAAAWMTSRRNAQGGYAFLPGAGATEANSTAIVIMALRALGRRVPAATAAALRGLQQPDGGFAFTAAAPGNRLLASTDAVTAVAGAWLPPPFRGAPG